MTRTGLFSTYSTVPPASQEVADSTALRRVVARINSALRDSTGGSIVSRLDIIIQLLIIKMYDEFEVQTGQKVLHEVVVNGPEVNAPGPLVERLARIYHRASQSHEFCRAFPPNRQTFELEPLAALLSIGILQPLQLSTSLHDVKGAAFQEVLRDTFDKNENQQFFTPFEIASFLTGVAAAMLRRPLSEVRVCDPAVGTGGLLLGIVREALAVLQREAPGKDKDDRVQAYLREQVYGADIDERMTWIAGVNIALLGGSAANVLHLNGAGGSLTLNREGPQLPAGQFQLVITNPPFGSDIVDPRVLQEYELGRGRSSRRRSMLFVERSLGLLEPGGVAVLIVDDSVLNQPTAADVRQLIEREAHVRAVFSLPDTAFMPYATVKSSVLVLQKRGPEIQERPIFMADLEHTGRKPNGEVLYADVRDADGNRVMLSDFPAALDALRHFMDDGLLPAGAQDSVAEQRKPTVFLTSAFDLATAVAEDRHMDSGELGGARLDVVRYHPTAKAAREALSLSPYPVVPLQQLVTVRSDRLTPSESPEEFFRYVGLADIEKLTGDWTVTEVQGDTVKSSCNTFAGGDIVFARMRPNLRKVVLVPEVDAGGICSSECLVLTLKQYGEKTRQPQADPEYLAWLLRSDLVYGQVMAQVTGVGRPRVSTKSLLSVSLPLPPIEQQRKFALHFKTAQQNVTRVKQEALTQIEQAEQSYAQILQQVGHPAGKLELLAERRL